MPYNGNDSDTDSSASNVSRRQLVKTVSAAGVGGLLAGCDTNDPATDSPTSSPAGDSDDTETETEGEQPLPNVDQPFRHPYDDEILEGEMNMFHPEFRDQMSWNLNARFGNRHMATQEWIAEDDDGYEHFPDENEIHFTIKDDLYWHPAQEDKKLDPVTAEDIVFGEKFTTQVEKAGGTYSEQDDPAILEYQVGEDPKTLVLKLNEDGYLVSDILSKVSRYWIHFYRNGWAVDFSERIEDATTDDAKADIHEEILGFNYNVGENQAISGPYYFDKVSPNDGVLQRIDDHWTQYIVNWDELHWTSQTGYQAARTDRIDHNFDIPDRVDNPPENLKIMTGSAAAELNSLCLNYGPKGTLDPWLQVDVDDSSKLANGDLTLAETGTAKKKHAKVWQAVTLGTSFSDVILNDSGERTLEYAGVPSLPGPTSPNSVKEAFPDVIEAIPNYTEQNQDLAEEKLQEAGLTKQNGTYIKPDGDKLTLEFSSFSWTRSFISTIVEDVGELGVDAVHVTRDNSMFSDYNDGVGYAFGQDWTSNMDPIGMALNKVFGSWWPNRNVPRYFEAPPVGEFDAEPTETYDIKELCGQFTKTPYEEAMEDARKALWAYFYHLPKIGITPFAPESSVNTNHFDWPEHPDWEGKNFLSMNPDNASKYWFAVYGVDKFMMGGKAPVMAKDN